MTKTTATIQGGRELQQKLLELDRRVAKKITSQALRAGAKVVLQDAKSNAPRRAGTLAKSLKVRAGKRKRGVVAFNVQTRSGDYKGATFYGAFLHYGYRIGSRKLGNKRKWVAANPYLAESFERTKDAALNAVIKTTQEGIAAAVK